MSKVPLLAQNVLVREQEPSQASGTGDTSLQGRVLGVQSFPSQERGSGKIRPGGRRELGHPLNGPGPGKLMERASKLPAVTLCPPQQEETTGNHRPDSNPELRRHPRGPHSPWSRQPATEGLFISMGSLL